MKNGFYYENAQLCCQGIPLKDLAKKLGTPLWVYDIDLIKANFKSIVAAFNRLVPDIYYAVKANDNMYILNTLHQYGCGFDAVSMGEIWKVLRCGTNSNKVVFAGAAKELEELHFAIGKRIGQINVESVEELERISKFCRLMNVFQAIAIRVAPMFDVHAGHAKISTAHVETKFGIEVDQLGAILDKFHDRYLHGYDNIILRGLHCHIGSQISDPKDYAKAISILAPFYHKYDFLENLDLGGGLPVEYQSKDSYPSFKMYAQAIEKSLKKNKISHVQLSIEPGRSIVANAGVLLTEIQSVKNSGGKRVIAVNGGMADLIRPAIYDAYHGIMALNEADAIDQLTDIAGPICESSDYLGKNRLLPELHEGDYLAVMTAGAYGRTMSSNYNASRLAAEVAIENGRSGIIRTRQSLEDLTRNEIW